MATSGSKSVTVTKYDTLKFSWEAVSQSVANNTTTINWTMILIATDGGRISSTTSKSWEVVINGQTFSGSNKINIANNATKVLAEGSATIPHNVDGTKTFSYSFNQDFRIIWGGETIYNFGDSGTGVLEPIARAATITSAPNFNDEANPTINYNNPAGSAVTKLEACISLDGSKDDVGYRDISKTGSSYTFNLTAAERKVLRQAAANSNSISVRFYVQTTIGGTVYRKSVTKTLSIINATPTLAPTAWDSGSVSTTLTGDAQGTIIKGYNVLNVAANASAKKEATIKSYKITCDGQTATTATAKFSYIESPTITVSVTDSRGNTASKTITQKFIDYIKLTCNMAIKPPTTSGDLTFDIKGNYFNGSFGAVNNSLTVQYRYKASDSEYSEWITAAHTISGNTYNAKVDITGLDYRTSYTFQARAQDAIYNGSTEPYVETVEKRLKTLPVFDWDEDSFAFHVPLFLDNTKQIWIKDIDGVDTLMISINASNQAFFGYGMYNANIGSTYFDGNNVYIRSKNNIANTASGTIGGNKAWTNSSDSRLKEDIADIPEIFSAIWYELQPKMFRWNEINKGDNSLHFGLIAQDVIEVFSKYGLDYRNYGFVATIPVDGVEYFALTYEYYNMLTAKVLKNTIEELNDIKKELVSIKAALAS